MHVRRLIAFAIALGVGVADCSGSRGSVSSLPMTGGDTTNALGTRVAAVPAGWAATGTQAFTLNAASDLGALAPTTSVTIRVGLALHNMQQLQQLVQHLTVISASQAASYEPTAAEAADVTKYLSAEGFTNITVEPNNVLISATGSAATVSKAFNTTLHQYTQNGKSVFANISPAYVPAALKGIAIAVLGLNNVQAFAFKPQLASGSAALAANAAPLAAAATPAPKPETACNLSTVAVVGLPEPITIPPGAATLTGCYRAFIPSDYWRAYDAISVPAATNVNVAVMAEGNVQASIANLRVNESGDALVQAPVVVKPVGVASTDTSGVDEWTLDMIASSGMARAVKTIYLYDTTSLSDSDIALEFSHFVTDDLARVANASFGGCEYGPYLDGSMLVDDEILLEGAAKGQTLFASSGDTGSFCSVGTPNGVPAGAPFVEYPASSPYVAAVGGTTLVTKTDGSYQGELGWYSGGGGLSLFEYSPYWESGVQPVSSTPAGLSFRGVPDLAMDADLTTGMSIYLADEGGWTTIGGTSLASPLAAGVWARLLQSHSTLAFGPPCIYAAFAATKAAAPDYGLPPTYPHGPFHDVLVGANGIYTSGIGYDYQTGLGSLDVGLANAYK